jgi:hypothetical protein
MSSAELNKWSIAELRKHMDAEKGVKIDEGVTIMPSDEFDKLLETYKGSGTYEQVKDYIKDDIRAIYMMAKGSK